MLTQADLKAILHYNPATGVWTWLVSNSNRIRVGERAGCIGKVYGYRLIGIDGKLYNSARLAWLYMTGEWPPVKGVDHANGIRDDDRWVNLRAATPSQQQMNRGKQSNNTSGYKGVHYHRQTGTWRARISAQGKFTSLGLYSTREAAHAAYAAAAAKFHASFGRVE